jgi:hypothetical protein
MMLGSMQGPYDVQNPTAGPINAKYTQYMANEYVFLTLVICEALAARPDSDIYQRKSVFHPLPFRYDSNCLYTLVIYVQPSIKLYIVTPRAISR